MRINRTGKVISIVAVALIIIKLFTDYDDKRTFGDAKIDSVPFTDYLSLFKNIKDGKVYSIFSFHNPERYPYWFFSASIRHSAFEYATACYKYDCVPTFSLDSINTLQDNHVNKFFDTKYLRWTGNVDYLYQDRKPPRVSRLTVCADQSIADPLIKNDSLAYYYLNLDQVAIVLNGETVGDIFLKNAATHDVAINLAFVKRNGFVYVVLCCNDKLKPPFNDPWALASLLAVDTMQSVQ